MTAADSRSLKTDQDQDETTRAAEPAAVSERVCKRLRDKGGLEREQVLLSSSHTHTGPALSLDPKPRDGRMEVRQRGPRSSVDAITLPLRAVRDE